MIFEIDDAAKQAIQDSIRNRNSNLWSAIDLKQLFFEVTSTCNLHCAHCGSKCETTISEEVPTYKLLRVLDDIITRLEVRPFICITGGEPLLRSDLCTLGKGITERGCLWGMTTNATKIGYGMAHRLKDAGCRSITVSLDGMEAAHDEMRGMKGAWKRAVRGIDVLIHADIERIDVMTCVHKGNIDDLENMLSFLMDIDIASWRIDFVDPIGRALEENSDMILSYDERKRVLEYVKACRDKGIPVTTSCPHFHDEFEMECRNTPFMCGSGITVASIASNGDIVGCLDCARTFRTIFGNVYKDDFVDVWQYGFTVYRNRMNYLPLGCKLCRYVDLCAGGSMHTFDFDICEQRVCFVKQNAVR